MLLQYLLVAGMRTLFIPDNRQSLNGKSAFSPDLSPEIHHVGLKFDLWIRTVPYTCIMEYNHYMYMHLSLTLGQVVYKHFTGQYLGSAQHCTWSESVL